MALTEKNLKQIRDLFNKFDVDGSGAVSHVEVQGMLAKFGLKLETEKVENLVKLVDYDNTGEIDIDEFIQLIKYALDPKSIPKIPPKSAKKASKKKTRSFEAPQPIFTFLSGNDPKYVQLTAQAIKFLKRTIPTANVGIVSPPGNDVKPSFEKRFKEIDVKFDVNAIEYYEGQQHFDDWNYSQHILDIVSFTEKYDPIIFLDSNTVILQDLLPFLQTFIGSPEKKFAFFPDIVNEYPNFQENWPNAPFIPRTTFLALKSAYIPDLFKIWQETWKEWIEPAPFVQHKDPARFYKFSRLSISGYSLGQSVAKYVKNFDEEVLVINRADLKVVRNFGLEAEKIKLQYLSSGSSFANDGKTKITIAIRSAKVHEKQDLLSKGDPYVKVKVADWERTTKTIKNTLEPQWNDQFVYDDVSYADAATVSFALWDADLIGKDNLIGTAKLSLLEHKTNRHHALTHFSLPVVDTKGKEQAVLEVDAEFFVEQTTKVKGGRGGGGRGAGRGATRPLLAQRHHGKGQRPNRGPPPSIPEYSQAAEEQEAKQLRWAKFAAFMAKPFDYPSIYKTQLQELDALGAINLKRVTRRQWPPAINVAHIAYVNFCPYEGLVNELSTEKNGVNIVGDAITVVKAFIERGYRVVYLQDPTVNEFTPWLDFFLEKVQVDIAVYFSGYGKKVLDYSLDAEKGEIQSVILLYNEDRKAKGLPPPEALSGVTDETVSEEYLFNNIATVDYPDKKVTFYFDLYSSSAVFKKDSAATEAILDKVAAASAANPAGAAAAASASISSKISSILPGASSIVSSAAAAVSSVANAATEGLPSRLTPPPNTVLIESSLNLDAEKITQKGVVRKGRLEAPSGGEGNSLSLLASSIVSQNTGEGLLSSLSNFLKAVFEFLINGISSITSSYSPETDIQSPLNQPLNTNEIEPPITQIIQDLGKQGISQDSLTEIPPPVRSDAEKKGSEDRWNAFVAEMKKPAAYTSQYKAELNKLDSLGAINLSRITRAQLPDIEIDRVVALFFNPYEGLPHTLEAGPINDGVTMATLYLQRGYHVVYLCDGTPKEYYTWMDWLLDNAHSEVVGYFSGHGTQVTDKTGREKDGLSELLVFYDESKKKDNQGAKIKAQTGITENTISDDLMHDLIVSKQYDDTRVILISDCCHSGTMFDFDQPLDSSLTYNKPPLNVITIGAAKDEQTAKQVVLGGKESGVFTYNFAQLEASNPKTTFNELSTYMSTKIAKYQNIEIHAVNSNSLKDPIISDPPSK